MYQDCHSLEAAVSWEYASNRLCQQNGISAPCVHREKKYTCARLCTLDPIAQDAGPTLRKC